MSLIPMMIDMAGKKVIVIGGGRIACRRIEKLIETGSSIHIISPTVTGYIKQLYKNGLVNWEQRTFTPSDVEGAFLVIAATNNLAVNEAVMKATPENTLINVVSDGELGNVQLPTYLKRGKLSIAISTAGASPTLAREISKKLESEYDNRYEAYLDFLYEARTIIKTSSLSNEEKRKVLKQIVAEPILRVEDQQQLLSEIKKL